MVNVKTKYDSRRKLAIIEPIEIKVIKNDYDTIQTLTKGQFGYLFITEKIELSKGRVTYLDLEYIKGEPFELDVQNLHPDLAKLPLETLNLSMNELKAVPEAIRRLTKLKQLWIYENNLQELPDWIGELKGLEDLNLGQNALKSIPESIGNLHSLKELIMVQNPIITLPESLTQINTLENLVVDEKFLDRPSQKIKQALKSRGVEVI